MMIRKDSWLWGVILLHGKMCSHDVDTEVSSVEMSFLAYKMDGLWEFPQKADEKFVFDGPLTLA